MNHVPITSDGVAPLQMDGVEGWKLVSLAKHIATHIHSGQERWDGQPYINHCLAVEAILARWGAPAYIRAVGLLHDTMEDHPEVATREFFRSQSIPTVVIDMVEVLSHFKPESYADYIARISKCRSCSMVKLADLEHNIGSKLWTEKGGQRMEKYKMAEMYLRLRTGL